MSKPEQTLALYQFPISHYCEKTRWHLDAKGLAYAIHDLVPGPHRLILRRVAGITTVPVLIDRGTAVGDSAAIAQHLERAYPARPLLPADSDARARVLELEAYFDALTGVVVRQWIYGKLLEARSGSAAAVMFSFYRAPVRLVGKLIAPVIEREIHKQYHLTKEGIARAEQGIGETFDRIERATGGDPSRYLVGASLTLADITAASLLGPLVVPPGSPWDRPSVSDVMSEAIQAWRASLATRPGWAWVRERYARDRPARLPA